MSSTVAIIGAGGLGGMVSLLLARVGVGCLRICDGDAFDESNLNRQFLSSLARLGQNKAEVAAEVIAGINPAVEVAVFPFWANEENLPEILGSAGVVIDCLDNLETRYLVEKAAVGANIPFVHGAVAGMEGFVMTVYPGDPGLIGLYGPLAASKKESAESILGVPTVTPALAAGLQVNEALFVLLGKPAPARKRLLHLDRTGPSIDPLEIA